MLSSSILQDLFESTDVTLVEIDIQEIITADYDLILESFDLNSTVQSTLKTDTIRISVI